jgi:hypothetical protein
MKYEKWKMIYGKSRPLFSIAATANARGAAHIRSQHFRDHNRAILLLVVLQNSNPGTPNG